jgi:hypothetical protein
MSADPKPHQPIPHHRIDRLCLEISTQWLDAIQALADSVTVCPVSTLGGQWRHHLNQMCLDTVLPWLQEEYRETLSAWQPAASASIWAMVNGAAVGCGKSRFILIPALDIDQSELRVPQEWVDIPSWAGDYYLAVQVNLNEGCLYLWAYTTHALLKQHANYDVDERMYSLSNDHLIHHLSAIQIAEQLQTNEPLRSEIPAIPSLGRSRLNALVEQLSNLNILFPRLSVPFQTWAGLIQLEGWRQRLYQRRQGLPNQERQNQWTVPQWLQAGISDLGQSFSEQPFDLFGWQVAAIQPALGMRHPGLEDPIDGLRREVTIAAKVYELLIFPRVEQQQQIWRFELRDIEQEPIPLGFKLRLLTDELQPFEHNEDVACEGMTHIYVDVAIESGEGIVWEIEPTPDNYVQEILNF